MQDAQPENTPPPRPEIEKRSLSDVYLTSGAAAAGFASGKLAVDGGKLVVGAAAEKIKDAFKHEKSEIWVPPDHEKK